jgi:hypothetical protein
MFFASKYRKSKSQSTRTTEKYVLEGGGCATASSTHMAYKFDAKSSAAKKLQGLVFEKIKEIW